MKTNVVFVSLLNEFNKKIAMKIAKNLDLYYADAEDLIEYHIVNENEVEKICGTEYLNELKSKSIKSLSTFENTLITISYGLFLAEKTSTYLKKSSTIVFLKFPKKILEKEIDKKVLDKTLRNDLKIQLLAVDEHNKLCEEKSDIVIELPKFEKEYVYKKIMSVLNKYFL